MENESKPKRLAAVCTALGIDPEDLIADIFEDADQVNEPAETTYRLRMETVALKTKVRRLEHSLHTARLRARRGREIERLLRSLNVECGEHRERMQPTCENCTKALEIYQALGMLRYERVEPASADA